MHIPADVPKDKQALYCANMEKVTKGKDRLMLFAGDQKVEHLNDDFFGKADIGNIPSDDNSPEHLFKIAREATIGCFAAQFGLISQYGRDYISVPYLVKLNSKSHLVKSQQRDPESTAWFSVQDALSLKRISGLDIVGIGFTVYVGSEFENGMLVDAARAVHDAHKEGQIAVLWMYPRGKAISDEKDPHIIAGAAGIGAALGADFCKVNYPKPKEGSAAESFKEAVAAAGRTRVITAGGSSTDARKFLQTLHDQIFISGAKGSATGRNIHQKTLQEGIAMANAISSITYGEFSVDDAMKVYEGKKSFKI
jgi:fructose-bisphosphate aldolase/6-deoxy-5-ketofructose 1-phosphate synthase